MKLQLPYFLVNVGLQQPIKIVGEVTGVVKIDKNAE